MDSDQQLDFDFYSHNVVNKVIMKSEALKEIFSEIDGRSEVIEILLSPDPPHLRYTGQ